MRFSLLLPHTILNLPSLSLIKNTGAPYGDIEGWMRPFSEALVIVVSISFAYQKTNG